QATEGGIMKASDKNILLKVERSSLRFENALLEQDTLERINVDADANTSGYATRLVIDDAISASKLFIGKKRSEFGELNTLLRNITHPKRLAV
ncbi:MAG: hypothetical protein ABIU09_07745, partial [Pyrinomonadaceae bacterium]